MLGAGLMAASLRVHCGYRRPRVVAVASVRFVVCRAGTRVCAILRLTLITTNYPACDVGFGRPWPRLVPLAALALHLRVLGLSKFLRLLRLLQLLFG